MDNGKDKDFQTGPDGGSTRGSLNESQLPSFRDIPPPPPPPTEQPTSSK